MTSKSAELSEKGTLLSPPSQSQHGGGGGGGGEEEAPLSASLHVNSRYQLLLECHSQEQKNVTGTQDLRGDRLVNFLLINTDTR